MQDQLSSSLAAARHLAASGRYQEAEGVLDELGRQPDEPALALLRAKIRAQQGRFEEAIALWRAVLARDPACAEAQAGVAEAERRQARRTGPLATRALVGLAGGGLLVVAVLLGAVYLLGRGERAFARLSNQVLAAEKEQQAARQETLVLIGRALERMGAGSLAEVGALRTELEHLATKVHDLETALAGQRVELAGELEPLRAEVAATRDELERGLADWTGSSGEIAEALRAALDGGRETSRQAGAELADLRLATRALAGRADQFDQVGRELAARLDELAARPNRPAIHVRRPTAFGIEEIRIGARD